MALRDRNRLLVEIVAVAALLLAAATVVLGWIAGSALRQRDRAVREGVLLVLAADLQGELRAIGPGDAASHLRAFVRAHAAEVARLRAAVKPLVVGRWWCSYCNTFYAEYINGCPKCSFGEPGTSTSVVLVPCVRAESGWAKAPDDLIELLGGASATLAASSTASGERDTR